MDGQREQYLQRRRELLDEIRELLVDELNVPMPIDQIDPDIALFGSGLALDSVDAVDFVVALEERTGVRIPDGDAGRAVLRSLNTAIDHVMDAKERA
jgi:acyl carrier protein